MLPSSRCLRQSSQWSGHRQSLRNCCATEHFGLRQGVNSRAWDRGPSATILKAEGLLQLLPQKQDSDKPFFGLDRRQRRWYSCGILRLRASVGCRVSAEDMPAHRAETSPRHTRLSRGHPGKGNEPMRLLIPAVLLSLSLSSLILASSASHPTEAPTGFDGKSNGVADDATHQADQAKFDEFEQLSDGLGPLYNAQSCRECHQSPVSGAGSQVSELRVGHEGPDRHFHNPDISIAHGTEVISGRSLVNDRAICPNAAFPNNEIQERVPQSETIRTFRLSLNLLGDGFVEAVADQTLIDLASEQCKSSHRKICGQVLQVPIVEAPGQMGVGRFGWKDQHASLLSFAGDAYLNEMGITNRLQPDEVTNICNTVSEPNDTPGGTVFPTSITLPVSFEPRKRRRGILRSRAAPWQRRAKVCSARLVVRPATSRR